MTASRLAIRCSRYDPFRGKLDLPGGFLHHAEHPFDGAKREAREELSVEIEIVDVLGFVMDTYDSPDDADTQHWTARANNLRRAACGRMTSQRWFGSILAT